MKTRDYHQICLYNPNVEHGKDWDTSSLPTAELEQFSILHLGKLWFDQACEISRPNLNGVFFFVCLEGKGEVLINNQWETVSANQACILPPLQENKLRSIEGQPWECYYIRYYLVNEELSPLRCSSPVISQFDASSFSKAILGTISERMHDNSSKLINQWVTIAQEYADKFASPLKIDDRLASLWNAVECDISDDWTLTKLAKLAGLSNEQLRRLCHSSTGRSPMKQVAWMRVQKAIKLMHSSSYKIEAIAYEVGFKDASTFSNTFKRITGTLPSAFQKRYSPH